MSDIGLGKIIDGKADRDAVHVAVAPVTAGQILTPGEHVGFMGDSPGCVGRVRETVGIVDPFLDRRVMTGERFYLVLYPNTVTGMRHHWSHPTFPDGDGWTAPSAPDKAASERWLRNFMDQHGLNNYDGLVAVASGQVESAIVDGDGWRDGGSGYLISCGNDAYGEIPDEFWSHVEVVTGRKIPHSRRASAFSCSC
jgi:hypothetical protein